MSDSRDAIDNVLLPSKIIGLFWYRRDSHDIYRLWLPAAIVSGLFVLMSGSCLAYSISANMPVAVMTFVSVAINYVDSIFMLALPVVSLIETALSIDSFNGCLVLIQEAENIITMQSKKIHISNVFLWKTSIIHFLMIPLIFIVSFIDFMSYKDFLSFGIVQCFFYCFLYVQITILCFRFFGIVAIISIIFEYCSKQIQFLEINPLLRVNEKVSQLELLVLAHDKLCRATFLIDDTHKYYMTILFPWGFITLVTEFYEMLSLTSFDYLNVVTLFYKATWLLGTVMFCSTIAGCCDTCRHKAKQFNTLLYQLMIEDKMYDFVNCKKLQLHISLKREVIFTACGLFTLDYSLLHSMLAAATTYLVILIQFGQPLPSKPDEALNITSTLEPS